MTFGYQRLRPLAFREFSSGDQLASKLALTVAEEIVCAVDARQFCHMVIPGGESPKLFFKYLSACDLPWHRIHLYPSDERCVPVGSLERNDAMIEEFLLSRIGLPRGHLHRIPAELGPEEGARCYAQTLKGIRDFDIAVLGTGSDGHVASLFHGHQAFYDCHDAVPVIAAPKPPSSRVSIGFKRLFAASSRHVMVVGMEKRAIFSLADREADLPVLQFDGNIWCA